MKRILFVLLFGISIVSYGQVIKNDVSFIGSTDDMLQFEKEIAYFYGAYNSEVIANHYLDALKQLEALGMNERDRELARQMLPALVKAYTEVAKQTQLKFDINQAAELEASLILAQARKASFEKINSIMIDLYVNLVKE